MGLCFLEGTLFGLVEADPKKETHSLSSILLFFGGGLPILADTHMFRMAAVKQHEGDPRPRECTSAGRRVVFRSGWRGTFIGVRRD